MLMTITLVAYIKENHNIVDTCDCGQHFKAQNHVLAVHKIKKIKCEDLKVAMMFGVNTVPQIVFFRDGVPAVYDSPDNNVEVLSEDIQAWLNQAKDVATQELTDETFEHLTQAATGATTGDWLVIFYCPKCEDRLPAIEGAGVNFRHGKIDKLTDYIVDRIRTSFFKAQNHVLAVHKIKKIKCEDLKVAMTFGVNTVPQIVFFRDGVPAVYDSPDNNVEAWLNQAKDVATQELTDETFEHLTQAATGATTGDWLVIFYCPKCEDRLPAIEGAGVNDKLTDYIVDRIRKSEYIYIINFRYNIVFTIRNENINICNLFLSEIHINNPEISACNIKIDLKKNKI
ncbi:hypothetical protein KUTeg_015755 [Tegillarca granosa]|uniref:Thioredoxin domain-containing protein n=1 Tax=Tegillarca granosa TaxID=220873 RepID=A0ABQ9END2_TEGGR|nr:hypothetical protein KUTeg_015755 [Tegillarca granosa]